MTQQRMGPHAYSQTGVGGMDALFLQPAASVAATMLSRHLCLHWKKQLGAHIACAGVLHVPVRLCTAAHDSIFSQVGLKRRARRLVAISVGNYGCS